MTTKTSNGSVLGPNNFNLENAFVIILKQVCDENNRRSLELSRTIVYSLLLYAFSILGWIVGAIFILPILWFFVVISVLLVLYTLMRYRALLNSPEKRELDEILYSDYYLTHKVNNEGLMRIIASAHYRSGQLDLYNTIVKATSIGIMIVCVLSIIGSIIGLL